MNHTLHVKVDDTTVGSLNKENDLYIFSYHPNTTQKFISLTMPKRVKDYTSNKLHPIFEMHLPEGYLLSIIKKHFSKIAKTDDFGLLKLISSNIKAKVSYETPMQKDVDTLELNHLLHSKKGNLFDDLVHRFALTSALSGVQPKVMARVTDKATLHLQDYIVKSWGDDYPQLALNEYFCMSIAKLANIPTPNFYLSDDYKLFIMDRFDVKEDGGFLGFEDMCVLQAKNRDDKYEGSYERVAKTIKTFVSPQNKKASLEQFFKMIVINNLVKNGDAHLKNFGLLYDGIDDIKLAPAYDIVCTTIYIKNDISALTLLGSKKWWKKEHLVRFGTENCELTNKNACLLYDECQNATMRVKKEIDTKIKTTSNKDIKNFLVKLLNIL